MVKKYKGSILVVDDDEDVRRLLLRYLEELGYVVASAASGAEAIVKIREHAYDLVFIDHSMPVMTGPEALRQLRMEGLQSKVIVITGSTEEEVFEEFMTPELNVDGFVNKPLEPAQIEKCIEQVLVRNRKLFSPL